MGVKSTTKLEAAIYLHFSSSSGRLFAQREMSDSDDFNSKRKVETNNFEARYVLVYFDEDTFKVSLLVLG